MRQTARPRSLTLACLASLALAAPAVADEAAAPGQKRNGGVLGVDFSTAVSVLNVGNGAFVSMGLLQGGLFGGYKLDRVIFGLGLQLTSFGQGQSTTVGGVTNETSRTDTAVVFLPGVRVAILRSSDQRVELFGQLDIGYGHTFTSQKPEQMGMQPPLSNDRLIFDVAPGVRYFPHPQLALAALAGLSGNLLWQGRSQTMGNLTQTFVATTTTLQIFGGLQLLGIF